MGTDGEAGLLSREVPLYVQYVVARLLGVVLAKVGGRAIYLYLTRHVRAIVFYNVPYLVIQRWKTCAGLGGVKHRRLCVIEYRGAYLNAAG